MPTSLALRKGEKLTKLTKLTKVTSSAMVKVCVCVCLCLCRSVSLCGCAICACGSALRTRLIAYTYAQASSPAVKAIFILDSDGNRVCAKYYDKSYPTAKDQLALEKKLYLKTKNSNPRLEGAFSIAARAHERGG